MKPSTWYFRLEGDALDVRALDDLFKEGAQLSTLGDGHRYLVMELPFTSSEARSAQDAAEELLSRLNGIAQTIHGNHENVCIGSVSCRETPDGPIAQHVFLVGARIRCRAGVVGVLVTSEAVPSSTPIRKLSGDRFLEAADRDEHFDRALYLYGSLPRDWRGLYMVLEAAEDGNGGEKGLIARAWVDPGAIKDFKATANSFRALGRQARHGSIGGISQPKQTIEAGRDMIRTILERWEKELSVAAP